MKIGLIGLPQVGKTTVFNLLTEGKAKTGYGDITKANIGMGNVHDNRIDYLSNVYKPAKTIYAAIEFIDLPGFTPSSADTKGASNFLKAVEDVDALVNIVRAFDDASVPHVLNSIDPRRDMELALEELLIADWELVEMRLEKITKENRFKKHPSKDGPVLEKCKMHLEDQIPLRLVDFSDEEHKLLRTYSFHSMKPIITVVNVSEEQLTKGNYSNKEALEALGEEKGIPILTISGKVEMEIAELNTEDRNLFMEDLGITESGINRLATVTYSHLGLISFFTVGADEVRAWTIKKGTCAKDAAGKIHSDLARGFIRAEVISFKDYKNLGSMAKGKEQGKLRLEGKDYIVNDGDIMNIRFNV